VTSLGWKLENDQRRGHLLAARIGNDLGITVLERDVVIRDGADSEYNV
jgi:hypothetical protein